jgi:hypothetical protein
MRLRSDATATGTVVALWLVSALLWLTPGITLPDGAGYFVYLPSAVLGGDLLFFDEWREFGMVQRGLIEHKEITATDHLGNHWTVGSAIAWLPGFLGGEILRAAVPALQRFPRNGISLPYNVGAATASAIAGLVTLLAGYRAARRRFEISHSAAAVAAIWFGSTLMWYSLKNPIMSHAVSAAACAAVVLLSLRAREVGPAEDSGMRWLAAGVACGFAIAVRPQNGTFLIVPLIIAGMPAARRLLTFAAGAAVGVLPQVAASVFLYGSPFGFLTGGGAAKPFAAFERIWAWQPLLSWYHGLIPWTPLLGLAAVGFIPLLRSDRRLGVAAVWAFGTQWFVNATLERSFWGAYAFGQRRFDNCTIFFILGLAALFARGPFALLAAAGAVACLWTMSLFFAGFELLDLNVYYTPAELLRLQGEALGRLGGYIEILDAVPSGAKGAVLLSIVVTIMIYAALLAVPQRVRAVAATGFLLAVATGITVVGARGLGRVEEYRPLIERNRYFGVISGGADARIGLLASEAEYLSKIGREEDAAEVMAESRRLQEMRLQALRAVGAIP